MTHAAARARDALHDACGFFVLDEANAHARRAGPRLIGGALDFRGKEGGATVIAVQPRPAT